LFLANFSDFWTNKTLKMRDNTPPHRPDFDDGEDELQEIIELEEQPLDEDDDDLEEVTLEQLEARLAMAGGDDDDDDEEDEEELRDRERIANIRDEAEITFKKHTAPVFACSLHPSYNWAVTGSEDDHAYVWETSTGDVLYEITDHKDTVTEAHFSHDGRNSLTKNKIVHKQKYPAFFP